MGDARGPVTKRRRRGPQIKKWIRRTHMYLGIVLVPWVVLYGVTAVLFNHSHWFTGTERYEVQTSSLNAHAAGLRVDAGESGQRAVDLLGRTFGDRGPSPLSLTAAPTVHGSYRVDAMTEDGARRVRVVVDGLGRGATISARPHRDEADERGPSWAQQWDPEQVEELGFPTEDEVADAARGLALEQGLSIQNIQVRRWPREALEIRDREDRWKAEVAFDGTLEVEPLADSGPTLRRQLLALHLQHGDPGFLGSRQLWALVVDAMGISMVLWALSGLVMWWSIRKTRRWGTVALLVGLSSMAVLAVCVLAAAGLA